MELKAYLRILRRKWWIVVPIFLVTLGVTIALTVSQTPLYQAAGTLIVRPGPEFTDARSQVTALDTLSNRAQIVATYAEIANSRLIRGQAATDLNLSSEQLRNVSVDAHAVAGTNLIEIAVQGDNPDMAKDFANTIGAKTVDYVKSLSEVYDLEPLDEAVAPRSPSLPNRTLNLALGAILGLVLGAGLAFLVEYLQTPADATQQPGIQEQQAGDSNQ